MSLSQDDSLRSSLIEKVELARTGDSEAFTRLFEYYHAGIYGYIRGLVNNVEDAHDLTQMTFLKAWEKLLTLQDASKFKSWLYVIARHLVSDQRRQKRKMIWESWEAMNVRDIPVSEFPREEEVAQLVRLALAEVACEVPELPPPTGGRRFLTIRDS